MTDAEKMAALERRVEELEAIVRTLVTAAEEANRIESARDALKNGPPALPPAVDRDLAVMMARSILRPLLAGATPEMRAKAIAEGPPAHAIQALTEAPNLAEVNDALMKAADYASAHALTWRDLGIVEGGA